MANKMAGEKLFRLHYHLARFFFHRNILLLQEMIQNSSHKYAWHAFMYLDGKYMLADMTGYFLMVVDAPTS